MRRHPLEVTADRIIHHLSEYGEYLSANDHRTLEEAEAALRWLGSTIDQTIRDNR